jgi:putative methionine-R-sulfoxide reductase with GAF domain
MHAMQDDMRPLPKPVLYDELESSLRGLLAGEPNLVACAANMSSLLYWSLPDLNWVGFYLLDAASGDLLVGPFHGKPACVRIPLGKGVCGAAATQRRTLVVPDVHAFPGHARRARPRQSQARAVRRRGRARTGAIGAGVRRGHCGDRLTQARPTKSKVQAMS